MGMYRHPQPVTKGAMVLYADGGCFRSGSIGFSTDGETWKEMHLKSLMKTTRIGEAPWLLTKRNGNKKWACKSGNISTTARVVEASNFTKCDTRTHNLTWRYPSWEICSEMISFLSMLFCRFTINILYVLF